MSAPQWLIWAQRLQAVAQSGLFYNPPPFDRERYEQILAIAAEMIASGTDADFAQVKAVFDAQAGHATPKVDVRAAVFQDNRILLVQEKLDHFRWTLPGGWADPGESPSTAVVREVLEESGYRVRAAKLVAIYDRNRHPHPPNALAVYKLFFLCDLLDDQRRVDVANSETGEVAFFPVDSLPDLSLLRVLPEQIARCHAHYLDLSLPTEFD